MNLVISGPQGSGKGTQAEFLATKLGMFHLEMGEVLRQKAKEQTREGRQVAEWLKNGVIIPDPVDNELVLQYLTEDNLKKGIIFDGFPRRVSQIEWLEKELAVRGKKIDKLILLEISKSESLRRLSGRRICPKCGRNFNLITIPPKNDNLCDDCGTDLIIRDDETPQAITKRLENYQKETAPMVEYYKREGKVVEINGEQKPQDVFSDILASMK